MTPTEFKYVLILAHFKHFGEASANCNVGQPALSIALKKFGSGLGLDLLERSKSSVGILPLKEKIIRQTQCLLDKAQAIANIANSFGNRLNSPLYLSVIFTSGSYLFPRFVSSLQSAWDN